MKRFWISVVTMFGWKFDIPTELTPEHKHSVYIMAPHTSILDFFLGAACVWKLGINARFFIKKEFYNKLTRRFLDRCGVIPVDRGNRNNNLVTRAVQFYENNTEGIVIITPEGTRKWVKRWKRGFYEIALQANVPIVLTYVDFGTRHMGVGPIFHPTGEFNDDMREIIKFYQDKTARHPEKFNKSALPYNHN